MRLFLFLFQLLLQVGWILMDWVFRGCTSPAKESFLLATLADLPRSKAELLAENALLRQQLAILHR